MHYETFAFHSLVLQCKVLYESTINWALFLQSAQEIIPHTEREITLQAEVETDNSNDLILLYEFYPDVQLAWFFLMLIMQWVNDLLSFFSFLRQ